DLEMQDGNIVTLMVSGFNMETDEYGNTIGITFTTQNLYASVTKTHYASSHAIMHYTIDGVAVADSTTTYTYTHEADTTEIIMEATGDTRLASIKVTDTNGNITCWYFNKSTGTNTDTATYYTFGTADNIALGTSQYWNGLILNGVMGRIYKYTSAQYFTKMNEGASITIPVTTGATVEIKGAAYYNIGGYKYSNLRTYLTQELIYNIPTLLQSFIVPVKKGSTLGAYSTEVEYMYDSLWALSYSEVGFGTSSPYGSEGTKYPVYSDNASRIKKKENGSGSASYWWLRSPHAADGNGFWYVYSSGSYNSNSAYYSHCVGFGFAI
ncbi:MAG: hypothetical protein IJA72_02645, partial [Clostridia bacterium]|nr:hypothetical protein [Clostridia bacterium]